MNIMDRILNAQNGNLVKDLAGNFGLGESQTRDALAQLVPPRPRASDAMQPPARGRMR